MELDETGGGLAEGNAPADRFEVEVQNAPALIQWGGRNGADRGRVELGENGTAEQGYVAVGEVRGDDHHPVGQPERHSIGPCLPAQGPQDVDLDKSESKEASDRAAQARNGASRDGSGAHD